MRRSKNAPPVACRTCTRPTSEPRRGLCIKCYLNEHHAREPLSACAVCSCEDPRMLVRRTLQSEPAVLCGSCAVVLGRRPLTLEELRAELRPETDRRAADRRRRDRRREARRLAGYSKSIEDALAMPDEERRAEGRRAIDAA